MERLTTTPFGARALTCAQIERDRMLSGPVAAERHDKWSLFRDLTTARAAFGVTDRDLAVLSALLSFHPEVDLDASGSLIAFPSNAALSERAHGMAESTLRRHLAALVRAGLIQRHDSPNGKRYAIRGRRSDGVERAFGFDLRPLLVRALEISSAAAEARAAAGRFKRLREAVSLRLRDATKLLDYLLETGQGVSQAEIEAATDARRRFRRKLSFTGLEALGADLEALHQSLTRRFRSEETEKMSGDDVESERHYQNSKPDSYESELSSEVRKAAAGRDTTERNAASPDIHEGEGSDDADEDEPRLPLALVKRACPEIANYAQGEIATWRDLIAAAAFVRGMMGISPSAWEEAQRFMGPATAAIVVAAMLERAEAINSHGGYLRALSGKAAEGAFSPGPMVMALLNRTDGKAA